VGWKGDKGKNRNGEAEEGDTGRVVRRMEDEKRDRARARIEARE